MIETQQTILVAAAIGNTWCYVQDIQNWASLMPGCRECTVIDANDSRWILTFGIRVRGSGAMAPMWEAVSKPLLPVLAKSFAVKLKAQIEKTAETSV